MARELPAEDDLRALSERFNWAESRISALVRRAPTGDRRALLLEALAILLVLRREAIGAGEHVERAYVIASLAVAHLTARPAPDGARAYDLGRSLAVQLDRAVRNVEAGTRRAVAIATADNLDAVTLDAIAARVVGASRRVSLSTETQQLTRTIGRSATSRATRDVLGDGGTVEISGGSCGICEPLQGIASASLQPPFHANCGCAATPVGFTFEEHVAAMRAV